MSMLRIYDGLMSGLELKKLYHAEYLRYSFSLSLTFSFFVSLLLRGLMEGVGDRESINRRDGPDEGLGRPISILIFEIHSNSLVQT